MSAFSFHDIETPVISQDKYNPSRDTGEVKHRERVSDDLDKSYGVPTAPVRLSFSYVYEC